MIYFLKVFRLTIVESHLLVNTLWTLDIFYWDNRSISNFRQLIWFEFLIFNIWITCCTCSCQWALFFDRINPWLKPSSSLCYTCLNPGLNLISQSNKRTLLFNQLNLLSLSHGLIHILNLCIISIRIIYMLLLVHLLILLLGI